jgi:hypothetical protein
MKFFTTFCIFLCFLSNVLLAQDYNPIRKGLTYQYATANRDTLITLRVDSVYAVGSDSIFELDKKYLGKNAHVPPSWPWKSKVNNILGKRIINSPNGVYSFIASDDTLLLITTSPVNTTWFFSKKRNLQATLISKTYENVLGVMDSLVTIRVSNGKEIKISKAFGLVSTDTPFEYLLPDYIYEDSCINFSSYRLDAIKELKLGTYFSSIENIYNFEVGDKWGQLEENAIYPRPFFLPSGKIYYEVIGKEFIEESSSYDYKIRRVKVDHYQKVLVDTLSLEQYRKATQEYYFVDMFNLHTYEIGFNDDFQYMVYIDHDSLKVQSIAEFESGFYHVYSPGIGLTSYRNESGGGGLEIYKMNTVCFKKGDKTFGDCDELLAIILDTKPAIVNSKIEILPNPASEFIILENAKGVDYELINCYGSVILNGIIKTDQEVISVTILEDGLYYLKLESLESSVVKKLVISH